MPRGQTWVISSSQEGNGGFPELCRPGKRVKSAFPTLGLGFRVQSPQEGKENPLLPHLLKQNTYFSEYENNTYSLRKNWEIIELWRRK